MEYYTSTTGALLHWDTAMIMGYYWGTTTGLLLEHYKGSAGVLLGLKHYMGTTEKLLG